MDRNEVIERFSNLNIGNSQGARAPHKPLLLLFAFAKYQQGIISISFQEVEKMLSPLLEAYAPPIKSKPAPQLPYWHLQTDEVWEVENASEIPRQAKGFPTMRGIRHSSAHLSESVIMCFDAEPSLVERIARNLLFEHFPESLHNDILGTVGLSLSNKFTAKEQTGTYNVSNSRNRRDPKFRAKVLQAYEHRCALTGFQVALSGSLLICEAAHVRWHAYNGPDTVDNGVCLEPTMHKLFDSGAWSLSDDRRVLVSQHFTGSNEAIERLRTLHGAKIRSPLQGQPEISAQYIRWHREPDLGGVFREPALPL